MTRIFWVLILCNFHVVHSYAQQIDSAMARIKRANYYVLSTSSIFPVPAIQKSSTGTLSVSENAKIEYFDSNGDMIPGGPYQYGSREFSTYETAIVKKHNLWGMINSQGFAIIPIQYKDIRYTDYTQQFFIVKTDSLYALLDTKGNIKLPPIYQNFGNFSDGMMAVEQNNKWGFVDDKGNLVIQPQYNHVWQSFHEGYAAVSYSDENSTGFINKQNQAITGFKFAYPYCVNKYNAHIRDLTKYYQFTNGYALVRNKKCEIGAIDTTGKEVLPIRFYHIEINDSTIIGYRKKQKVVYYLDRNTR